MWKWIKRTCLSFCVLLLAILIAGLLISSPIDSLSIASSSSNQLEKQFDQIFSERLLSGYVLINQGNKVLFEKSYGWADPKLKILNTPHTKFNIGSCAKQMTGFLILQLEKEGKLNPLMRLETVLPELSNTEIGTVTIEQLLQMSGGVPNLFRTLTYVSVQLSSKIWTTADLLNEIKGYSLEFKPGTQFKYSNLSYVLLGIVSERVTGLSWEKALENRIFTPFQMFDSTASRNQSISNLAKPFIMAHRFLCFEKLVYYPMPQWNYSALKGAGGIISTCVDLCRWQRALAQFALDEPIWANRYFGGGGPGNYAFGWQLAEFEGKTIQFHGGETPGYCALICRDPNFPFEAILLFNSDFVLLNPTNQSIDELNRSIMTAMQTLQIPASPTILPNDQE